MSPIFAMQEAARVARLHSTVRDDRQTIEVMVTEGGIVVRGTYRTAREAFRSSGELGWPEVDANPDLIVNCVRLVADGLAQKVAALGDAPVRQ